MTIYVCSYDAGGDEVIEHYVATLDLALEWLNAKREKYLHMLHGSPERIGKVVRAFPKEHPENYHVTLGDFEMFIIRPQTVLTSLPKEG